jgi:hypothetical protein
MSSGVPAGSPSIAPVSTYVFIFYNPRSGNLQGEQMRHYAPQHTRLKENVRVQIQMYNLLDKKDFERGLVYLGRLLPSIRDKTVILVCSAGGDGSFVSILEAMQKRGIPLDHERIYFSVFGFGTGNDLSQSMNWGRYIPRKDTASFDAFAKHIYRRLSGTLGYMDLWKVNVVPRSNTGYVQKAGSPKQVTGSSSRLMSNYLTFGIQGMVGVGFERKRRTSRFLNVLEYTKQCLFRGVLTHVGRIREYISTIRHGGITYRLDNCDRRSVELVLQNLPGIWGRKMTLWDSCVHRESPLVPNANAACETEWTLSNMGDGKLEVYALKSRRDYIVKQIPGLFKYTVLQRLGQFSDRIVIECVSGKTFYMMMDGEFYTLHDIEKVEVKRTTRVKAILG